MYTSTAFHRSADKEEVQIQSKQSKLITAKRPIPSELRLHQVIKRRLADSLKTTRVAELGSLSWGAKIAMKIFVKSVITIFATNASFLRVIANLQI